MTAKTLPEEAAERKVIPLQSGVLDYFPAALVEVAKVSKAGNDQHNPGEPLHWSRGKSNDHADALLRHQLEHGGTDKDGLLHSAKVAWRALAQLQMELEAAGAPVARGATAHLGPMDFRDVLSPGVYADGGAFSVGEWTRNEYFEARDTLRDQGELHVHATGVCSLCDAFHQTIPTGEWVTITPPPRHVATL